MAKKIKNKTPRFKRRLLGYRRREVDTQIANLKADFTRNSADLENEIGRLSAELATATAVDLDLALQATRRTVGTILTDARAQAATMLVEATTVISEPTISLDPQAAAEPESRTGEIAKHTKPRRLARRLKQAAVSTFLFLVIIFASYVLAQRTIVVSGESMEPTMHTGDIVFVWPESSYEVGSVVVYRVPEGQPGEGTAVIHRVTGHQGNKMILQGDNNDSIDPWNPTADDIVGKRVVLIPKIGIYLAFLRRPAVLASLFAGIVTTGLLMRKP
jgi:signal peptidase